MLPPQASAKAVNLTDDSSWQNSAHPRKRSTFGKQRGQYDAGIWFSMASPSPEKPSFGGLQAARAARGPACHQTPSWLNREPCVLSGTKACIVLLVWASCLKDLEYTAVCLHVFYSQTCQKDKAHPSFSSASPRRAPCTEHGFLRVTNPPLKSLQHNQKCILSPPSMEN